MSIGTLNIATASPVLVLRCNYHDLQWGEAKTCRVQLVKKPGDLYFLRIGRRKDGRNIIEHKLSKGAVKIHFCVGAGFIQVLFTRDPPKVLYGIKFSNDIEGDKFYTKLIETIGITKSYLTKFEIGDDGHPIPHGDFSQGTDVPIHQEEPSQEPIPTILQQFAEGAIDETQQPVSGKETSTQVTSSDLCLLDPQLLPIVASYAEQWIQGAEIQQTTDVAYLLSKQPQRPKREIQKRSAHVDVDQLQQEGTEPLLSNVQPYHEQYMSEQSHYYAYSPDYDDSSDIDDACLSPLQQDSGEGLKLHGSGKLSYYPLPEIHAILQAGRVDGAHVHGEQPQIPTKVQLETHGYTDLSEDTRMEMATVSSSEHGEQYTTEQPRQPPDGGQELYRSKLSSHQYDPYPLQRRAHAMLQAGQVDDAHVHGEQPQSQIQESLAPHGRTSSNRRRFKVEPPHEALIGDYAVTQGSVHPMRADQKLHAKRFDMGQVVPQGLPRTVSPTSISPLHYHVFSASRQPSTPWLAAELLTDAMNRRDRLEAQRMLNELLNESSGEGMFEVIYRTTPTHSSAPTFTLRIQVEFQQPQKNPSPIFLFGVSTDDTLHTLSLRVEQEFFIPKPSQNWVIGPCLVKGTEMSKTLKDFGIRGSNVRGVCVFLYVIQRSLYLIEAERSVGISFLDHCVLECDCHGLEYTNKKHDITIRIPEGAVADGETVHIEFAVAMYGPFHFPENARPISPILWLCLVEKNARLKKPSRIILPHILDGLTEEKAKNHQVRFAKVHHDDFHTTASGQPIYNFQSLASEGCLLFSTIGEQHYGLLKTNHFCYLCMTAERNNPILEKNIDYCLARIQMPITDIRHTATFCLLYHLPTCIEAIRLQFPDRKFKTSPPFKLVECPGSVQLTVEDSKCTVAMEPILPVLEAKDVDFSTHSIKQLELMHRQETYPPRIVITFDTTLAPQQTLTIRVRVEGTNRDKQLSADLLLPFVDNSSSLSRIPITYVPHSQKVQDKMDEKPTPQDLELLKYTKKDKKQKIRLKIINRASHKWRDIAALICEDTNKIYKLEQTYHTDPVECLRQIFREDFINKKPARYSQNWEGIIELLNDVEQEELAEEVEHVIKNFADVVTI